ncbi:CCA tRNA nucleotidyltransferase [Verticiella sediminum]|uniref:CCA tRNA nucleotidyltransferase n=1 Tax=Verticiella sediminum TaxID=1247510 RepID=UPI001FE8B222|nr:CCA tRNA nucleotidyltransferase [Verticiella sediminum]
MSPAPADAARDPAIAGLDVYIVGGAVRDALLGRPAGDRDWVVVGASPEAMVKRGFIPVGGDFPVFLHPVTQEEYALARTERKSGRGYRGFVFHAGPDVTLEQDLQRRDLTVNAIAQRPDGTLVDPCGGQADLQARVLRHVGAAFLEDPVRILRLARFAARFHDFGIAPETLELCRRMVQEGEVDALVPERVWREVSRGLMEQRPSRMFLVLDACGALERVAPAWSTPVRIGERVDEAARLGLPLPSRYALACLDAAEAPALHRLLKVPTECADYARLLPLVRNGEAVRDAAGMLDVIERCDGLRKPERFLALLDAASACAILDAARWRTALAAARGVDAGAVAREHAGQPQRIRQAVHEVRLQAVAQAVG